MKNNLSAMGVALLLGVMLPTHSLADTDNSDPLEPINRKIFAFNEVLDKYFMKPVAQGYRYITPDFIETGVSNFYNNLEEIPTVANGLLQGKFLDAGSDTLRFVINSTVGLLGLIDVATSMGLEKHDEDFGQTLAVWGVGQGPYVVLPFLGPRTIRSATGTLVDNYVSAYELVDHEPTRWKFKAGEYIDLRTKLLDVEDQIVGDKYTFLREAYLQRREFLVRDGEIADDVFDDGLDDDFFDDEE